jgi:hypothetical protein
MSVTQALVVRTVFRRGGESKGVASAKEKDTSFSEQSHMRLPSIG